jgi:hypothetical protein
MAGSKALTKIRRLFGYNYILNKRTMEIHDLTNKVHNCGRLAISRRNRKWLTAAGAERMFATGDANGCRWCYETEDTDTPPRTRPGTRPGTK